MYSVCELSQRRPRSLQTVELERHNSSIHDDVHFDGICSIFVELSSKNGHTGKGELTIVQTRLSSRTYHGRGWSNNDFTVSRTQSYGTTLQIPTNLVSV